ncbi:MAG TPA: hypothetical protein VMX54_22340 [Vicinamibacteria bacterium]|nr:hypothetical protein [Vicinamibacteria bacterium]
MYCTGCHLTFGSAEEKVRVGARLFHLHCFEAAIRRALGTGSVIVVPARHMLTR